MEELSGGPPPIPPLFDANGDTNAAPGAGGNAVVLDGPDSAAAAPAPAAVAAAPPIPKKVQRTALNFKSDVRKSKSAESHPCGILHATRSTSSRDEHTFAWVADYGSGALPTLAHLERYGYDRDTAEFVPYSGKAEWISRYPHAYPYVECTAAGHVGGYPHWSHHCRDASEIPRDVAEGAASGLLLGGGAGLAGDGGLATGTLAGRQRGSGPKVTGVLFNSEREQLHCEVYRYFKWLAEKVTDLETSEVGRRNVKKADLSIGGIRKLLVNMEGTFKSVARLSAAMQGGSGEDGASGASLPLLESSLTGELGRLAEAARKDARSKAGQPEPLAGRKRAVYEPLDFDSMFQKLEAYRDREGDLNVPAKYPQDTQLGNWVAGLRSRKRAMDAAAAEGAADLMETDAGADADAAAAGGGGAGDKAPGTAELAPTQDQKVLTADRIERLESIGFEWKARRTKSKPKSWDERLEELRQWHAAHGTFKVPRAESLGEWLHNQRTLYAKRDTRFMTKKAPRMEAMGYKFEMRETVSVSWDERFQQLIEYGQTNGNYDVPLQSTVEENTEEHRFYKWVNRLHNEYRSYQKGTQSKLNAERVEKLQGINFVFKGPKARGRPSSASSQITVVPSISWEKRIEQVKAFKEEIGNLNIDHQYKHCSNLGGWAAEMSTLHREWKSGKQQLSEDMISKLNELADLGFPFGILPYYESNRGWETHYTLLRQYKDRHGGSTRVPLKYKADLRLGKWVATQRAQYKLREAGRGSKLTKDRIDLLNRINFEWDVTPAAPAQASSQSQQASLPDVYQQQEDDVVDAMQFENTMV